MTLVQKAAGVLILNGQCLLVRSAKEEIFVLPGGKIESGESDIEALLRELWEELSVEVTPADCHPLGHFTATGATYPHRSRTVIVRVMLVGSWRNEIKIAHEIEEALWVGAELPKELAVGSIFAHCVHPLLVERRLL